MRVRVRVPYTAAAAAAAAAATRGLTSVLLYKSCCCCCFCCCCRCIDCIVLYRIVSYRIVLHRIASYCIALYCSVLFCLIVAIKRNPPIRGHPTACLFGADRNGPADGDQRRGHRNSFLARRGCLPTRPGPFRAMVRCVNSW